MLPLEVILDNVDDSTADVILCPTAADVPHLSAVTMEGQTLLTIHPQPYQDGKQGEIPTLSNLYRTAMEFALENGSKTMDIAPLESVEETYPLGQTATLTLRAIGEFLRVHPELSVRMVCPNKTVEKAYSQSFNMWFAEEKPQHDHDHD